MAAACRTEGCTVVDTDVCLLDNDSNTCEFRISSRDSATEESQPEYVPPVLEAPEERPTLWGSLPLEITDIRELMAGRQCLLVGVLGTPAAGKTAALVSMYLLLSHGNLRGFQFADSRTLTAFEEISQGARLWGPAPPDEMTARTKTSGSRVAGFLHARLKRLADGNLIDLLVPDLPGEWSDTLIDTNRTDRLDFLRASNVIWVFVNGAEIRRNDMRMLTLNRTSLLLRRLVALLGTERPPVKIVVSHADAGALPDQTIAKLKKMCDDAGIDADIVGIASFSEEAKVVPGSGIAELIEASIPVRGCAKVEWPDSAERKGDRFMLRFSESPRL